MPDPRSALPLPHLSYQILLALADGPRHGWAIIKRIGEANDGAAPSSCSLYLSMLRLEKQKLLCEAATPDVIDRDDQRRRYYKLTPYGGEVLKAETMRLVALLHIAQSRHVIGDVSLSPLPESGA